jgi:ATP-binding cassette subfamily C (CFTR/MRP) protein 1
MAIVVKLRSSSDAGYVALALVNIMDIGPVLEMLVVAWTQLETSMGAIARMKEFIEDTPEEEQGQVHPPSDWMSKGDISITNLEASYSDTAPSTIKNINLDIKHGQKIAICGRTGSGKSSLASAVFGLLHISSGTLKIDGVDITTVSQELLRSKMIALPQDPYFTTGTVRENLALRTTDTKRSDAEMLSSLSRRPARKVRNSSSSTRLDMANPPRRPLESRRHANKRPNPTLRHGTRNPLFRQYRAR